MPDEKEVEEEEELEDDYSFPKSGVLSADILEEYLEKLDIDYYYKLILFNCLSIISLDFSSQ